MSETFINHCIKVYETMDEVSIDVKLDSGKMIRRYAGRISETYKTTGIAQTYYSYIFKALVRNNALQMIQRGGRNADTVYVLRGLPTVWDLPDDWLGRTSIQDKGLTVTKKFDRLAVDVQEIKESIGGINVLKALETLENRLKILELKLIKVNLDNKRK